MTNVIPTCKSAPKSGNTKPALVRTVGLSQVLQNHSSLPFYNQYCTTLLSHMQLPFKTIVNSTEIERTTAKKSHSKDPQLMQTM